MERASVLSVQPNLFGSGKFSLQAENYYNLLITLSSLFGVS
jgi:hypothetical protein